MRYVCQVLKQLLLHCFLFIFIPSITIIHAQSFHNLDFRQECDSSKTGLCYWDLSWGGKGAVTGDAIQNSNCLLIQAAKENSVGFAEQTSSIKINTPHIITVAAQISAENIEGKGAGLNIGLYDKDGNLVATKDMGGFYSIEWISGSTAWKEYSVSLVCPVETSKIKIGAIVFGKGKAWFKDYKVTLSPIVNRKPSALAVRYISKACDIIKTNSLVKDSINIKELKETALKIAGPAIKYSDCHLAVTYLLESLRPYGDEHSFLMKAEESINWEKSGSQVAKIQYPSYKIIDSCGYILVPPFHGGNQQIILAYADSTQRIIDKLQHFSIKGWIIDLRENTGGNQEPMIAGLGPLFSGNKLGSLVNVTNKSQSWYYKNGKYFMDGYAGWNVSKPVNLSNELPIAVLTSSRTGSSGEVVAISFIANNNTKSFGRPTWGLTTGNGSFDLPDGSKLFLASTIMADRRGKLYHGSIDPDILIPPTNEVGKDETIDKACEWIKNKHK